MQSTIEHKEQNTTSSGTMHTHACHSNALFAAPADEAEERADPELCRPPNTGPSTKEELAQWLKDKHSQLQERIDTWNRKEDWFKTKNTATSDSEPAG